jgi:hypothetical protein
MCKECSPARAKRVARMEVQAERLGDLQKFFVGSPLLPVVAAVVLVAGSSVIDSVADHLIRM